MSSPQKIVGVRDKKYFTMLPNIIDDSDLSPHEHRLLAHYYRVGDCWENVKTTADKCRMSSGAVSNGRKSLAEKGWIKIDQRGGGGVTITVIDRWHENMAHFVNMPVQEVNAPVHQVNGVHPVNGSVHSVNESVHSVNESVHSVKQRRTTKKNQLTRDVVVVSCVLDEIGFTGDATNEPLSTTQALSWLYWFWLNKSKMEKRPNTNPTAVTISKWRNKTIRIPADLLKLSNWWLAASDAQRRAIADIAPSANKYTILPKSIADCPIDTLAKIYKASGRIAPSALMPEPEAEPIAADAPITTPVVMAVEQTAACPIWEQVLEELKLQMIPSTFGNILRGTTATLNGKTAVVHAKTDGAAEWINYRFTQKIEQALTDVTERPYTITAVVGETA